MGLRSSHVIGLAALRMELVCHATQDARYHLDANSGRDQVENKLNSYRPGAEPTGTRFCCSYDRDGAVAPSSDPRDSQPRDLCAKPVRLWCQLRADRETNQKSRQLTRHNR